MKTSFIIDAINALHAADQRLMNTDSAGYMSGDIVIATRCFAAASALEGQLATLLPDVPVEAQP